MPTIEQSRKRAKEERLQAHRQSDTQFIVYNVEKGTSYEVNLSNGVWICSCPWQTHGSRLREGFCKHVVRVMDKVSGCKECGSKGNLRDGKCAECRFYDRMDL